MVTKELHIHKFDYNQLIEKLFSVQNKYKFYRKNFEDLNKIKKHS